MLFILQLLTLIAYLFNGYLGFGFSIILYLKIWINKKYSVVEKNIISLIVSIPVYNIGILGVNMHHIFSWYNIFILIFMVHLILIFLRNKVNKTVVLLMFFLISFSTINLLIFSNLNSAITDYFQIMIFIIVAMLSYQFRSELCKNVKIDIKILEKILNNTLLLIAIGIVLQYILLNYFNISAGVITFFPQRTVYDLFFKGYSVASILLGLSIIINVKKIFYEKNFIFTLFKIMLLLLALVINTSRTGLIVSFLISLIILLKNIFTNKRNFIIGIIFVGIFLLMFLFTIDGIMSNRNINNGNILNDNGRFETYINGIEAMTSNLFSFLFGSGLSASNYDFMMPHNFIIEMPLKLGIIFTIVVLGLFLKLIIYVKDNFLKLMIIYILLCNLFVTSFYQMSFMIIIIVYVIICAEKEYRRKNKK